MNPYGIVYKPPPVRAPRPPRPHPVRPGRATDWGLPAGIKQPGVTMVGGGGGGQHKPPAAGPYTPQTDEQIRAKALALIRAGVDPQEAAARAAAESRAQSGMSAIAGYTGQLANNLAGYLAPIGKAYGEAEQKQGSVNEALANRLGAMGQSTGAGLAQTLAGQPNAQQVGAQTTGIGTGAANAGFARGSAELSRLIANEATAKEYTAKQPGIAGLTGLQYGRNLQAQTTKELNDTIRQLEAGVPGAAASLYVQLLGDERAKAAQAQSAAAQTAAQKNADRNFGLQQQIARHSNLIKDQNAGEARRHHVAQERAKAADLGISFARLQELRRQHLTDEQIRSQANRERARANRAREGTASRNAGTSAQGGAETARHNRAGEAQRRKDAAERARHNRETEKKKGKSGNKPPGVP